MKKLIISFLGLSFLLFLNSCKKEEIKEVDNSYTFVQMSDPQLGMGGYEGDVLRFQAAVKQINELDPDFVIICGDLVHSSNNESYFDFLRIALQFNMRWYAVPGNHDVEDVPNDITLSYYRSVIGDDYFTFSNKGSQFIGVNTQLWKSYVAGESEKHDEWLKNTLERLKDNKEHLFVFGHIPFYVKKIDEKEGYHNLPIDKREKILDLMNENEVSAYLSGHLHETRNSNKYKNMLLVNSVATSFNLDDSSLGFNLWTVNKDSISYEFVPLQVENDS